MRENSPLERLYNGIIKENPTFDGFRHVSYPGSYHSGNEWYWYGAYYYRCPCHVKPVYFPFSRNVIPEKVRMRLTLLWLHLL